MKLHTIFFQGKYRRNKADNVFCMPFPSVNPSVIIFFLLPTDLPTDKKLLIKDSQTEHFRR